MGGKYFKVTPGRGIIAGQAFTEIYLVNDDGTPWSPDQPSNIAALVTDPGPVSEALNATYALKSEAGGKSRPELIPWYAGLGGRDTAPAKAVMIADSVGEGYNVSAVIGGRWGDKVARRLRSSLGLAAGGAGFIPFYNITTKPGLPVTLTGTVQDSGLQGFSRKSIRINDGGTAVVTVTGTSLDLLYQIPHTSATMSYQIDSETPVNFDLTDGTATVKDSGIKRITFASGGAHTVTFRRVSGYTWGYLEGVYVYNGDEAAGLHIYADGHHGYRSTDYVTTAPVRTALAQRVTSIKPHLVFIALGENDYLKGLAASGLKASLQTMIADIRAEQVAKAAPKSAFVLVSAFQADATTEVPGAVEPWANFVTAAQEVADEDTGGIGGGSGVLHVAMPDVMPPVVGDVLGLYSDKYHPNDRGMTVMADHIYAAIAPR